MLYFCHKKVNQSKDEDNDVDGEENCKACGSKCLIYCKKAEDPIKDDQTDDHQVFEPVRSDRLGQKCIVDN